LAGSDVWGNVKKKKRLSIWGFSVKKVGKKGERGQGNGGGMRGPAGSKRQRRCLGEKGLKKGGTVQRPEIPKNMAAHLVNLSEPEKRKPKKPEKKEPWGNSPQQLLRTRRNHNL